MPRYFFHVIEHVDRRIDPDGVDLPDDEAALREATNAARDILVEAIMTGSVVDGQIIEIVDYAGRRLQRLPLRDILRLDER